MVAVGGDDTILARDGGLHADGDGLLAIVEVAEAAYELGLVERVRRDLHPPHQRHVTEEREELRRGRLHGAWRRIAVVGGEGHRGLHGEGLRRGRHRTAS